MEKITSVFPMGDKNEAFAKYFIGHSYLNMLTVEVPAEGASNEWLEAVSDEEYSKL